MTLTWAAPPDGLTLPEAAIHLWLADLRTDLPLSPLSADEQARMARFHFEEGQTRYGRSHAILRSLLSRYLGLPPQEVVLETSPQGKPQLAGHQASSGLQFNLAHSTDWALIGITRAAPIGVDIESVRPVEHLERMAARYFAPGEQSVLAELSGDEKIQAFFTCWTCKEAFLKCLGSGLAHGLARFEVQVSPRQPARLLSLDGDTQEALNWQMACFPAGEDCLGAWAVRSSRPLQVQAFACQP